jgi:hypothetical protein
MSIYLEKIDEFGLDEKKVKSIIRRIEKAAAEAKKMGLWFWTDDAGLYLMGGGKVKITEFGGMDQSMIVAKIKGGFDGGGW